LDVCAAGDSVLIGPGRYDEFRVHTFLLGGTASVIMIPKVAPLTILGVDRDSVIVGPEIVTMTHGGYATGGFVPDIDQNLETRIHLSGLTIEKTAQLMTIRTPVSVELCRFHDPGGYGKAVILDDAPDVCITDCEFAGATVGPYPNGIISFVGGINPHFQIEGCSFRGFNDAISLDGAESFRIVACSFRYCKAIDMTRGSTGVIQNCTFEEPSIPGFAHIAVADRSDVSVVDVRTTGGGASIYAFDNANVVGSRCILSGGSYATLTAYDGASVEMRNSEIRYDGGVATVYAEIDTASTAIVDLRNCYWGTTDSTQIAEWIHDGSDDPRWKKVEFMPFLIEPVPVEKESVGSLKSLFRRR
jgi:hypothetical protein